MRQAASVLGIGTRGKGLVDFTREVRSWVDAQGMDTGLLTLWCRHTSASLCVQENASPEVLDDIKRWFERAVPEGDRYDHDLEGPDDMPAHIRSMLTGPQLTIPLVGGRLALGTWQGIYLFEHRRRPHRREVAAHLIGE
ncbi:MAG: YjbQ family protein [Gluconacetobacter diazotrophicus]|nr:YjbQ family protein [Gluconacetobacter diazotrophicus]